MATQETMTAEQLFTKALERVESKSIREWALSEQNRPIWVKIAQRVIDKNGPTADPIKFSAYITSTAIGL